MNCYAGHDEGSVVCPLGIGSPFFMDADKVTRNEVKSGRCKHDLHCGGLCPNHLRAFGAMASRRLLFRASLAERFGK